MTDLPIVQFKKLTAEQREKILDRLFKYVEYDDAGDPGADRSVGDIGAAVREIFDEFGVKFSTADRLPGGYRFSQHLDDAGRYCRWSSCSAVEPMKRTVRRGGIRCPKGCTASIIEPDPNVINRMINVDGIANHLLALGVPYTTVETSGGNWLVLIGNGEWDADTERFTHPIDAGPCYRRGSALIAGAEEFTYGLRQDGAPGFDISDHHEDPQEMARGIARLLLEQRPNTAELNDQR